MASPIPLTPLSAAYLLVSWMTAHGREPRFRECRSVHGLISYDTILKKFPGSSLSACISAARALVSHAPRPRMQTCLGPECEVRFLYAGYHFCSACRVSLGYDDADGVNGNGRYLRAHDRAAAARTGDIGDATGRPLRLAGDEGALYVATMTGQTMQAPTLDTLESAEERGETLWLHTPRDDVRADTVYGFDDLVASQMNAWQRLSRKRKYFGEK